MKARTLICVTAMIIFAALIASFRPAAQAQRLQQYTVTSLGSLGGTSCCLVVTINNKGWVDGTSNLAGDQSFHPFLWISGQMTDLGTLGGPNASVGGMNENGDVTVGGSDTGTPDPLGEDFCGFRTHQICRSFVWRNGNRTLVPALGGNNNDVSTINDQDLVLAFAETAVHDPTCIAPQVLDFEAFTWEPRSGQISKLPPLPGDRVSAAFNMNRIGQVVGTSGICAGITPASAVHPVLWQNGIPTDLGTLGGNTTNLATGINNLGQVVGVSTFPDNTTFHAVLWQNGAITDLGTLPGDSLSAPGVINDAGQVSLQSCDINFNCRAAIWQNGVMIDLNTLIPAGSPLFLVNANWINERGQIAGTALDQTTGALVPFLATPNAPGADANAGLPALESGGNPKITLPESVREQLRKQLHFGRLGVPGPRPQ